MSKITITEREQPHLTHGNFTVQLGLKYDYHKEDAPVIVYKLTREEMDKYLKEMKLRQVERRK